MFYIYISNFVTLSSAPNVALVTPPENFPTLFHPTLAMSEAIVAQRRVQQFLLPKTLLNARRLRHQRLRSPRHILRPNHRHHRQLPSMPPLPR